MTSEHIRIKNNRTNRALIIGVIVCIKLLLMGSFSSDYQDLMFAPFVGSFLGGSNPYEYYYQNHLLPSFPYFPLMLLIESVGGMLQTWFAPASIFLQNLLFKLPLLAFDLLGFWFIRRMKVRFKYVVVFYFFSPIILYATYMHGQLDIIPTTLLIISLYYLLDWKKRNNLFWHALFLGMALSTKFHILAAVPILFFYVAKKKDYATAVKCMAVTVLTVILLTAGFWGPSFVETVLFNREQSMLFAVSFDYGPIQILLPVLALAVIYLNVYDLNYFNKNLLVSMLGLLFAVFLIFISPMPAWFIWVVPFIALYFGFVEKDKYRVMLLYAGFNLLYLLYFVLLHRTEYVDLYFLGHSLQGIKLSIPGARNLVFTLMVACFAMIIFKIYRFGIASNSLYKRKNIPFTIGIAGDSGVGKSKLLDKIEYLFGTGKDVLFIEGDGDHRWARNDENWERYTALDPQANFLYRQAEDIRILRGGNHVERSEYDHDLGIFTDLRRVRPKKYIVLCGLHSLYLPQLRKELDLKIFMDTDSELRKFWKIQRDTAKRGYSKEQIVRQIEKRIPDAEKYIYPQKTFADMVISYFDRTLVDCFAEDHNVLLSVRITVDINLDLEETLYCFRDYGIHPQQMLCDDFRHQDIVFDGEDLEGKKIDFADIAERIVPQYEDFFTYTPSWGDGVEGIIQLFLLVAISKKMRG